MEKQCQAYPEDVLSRFADNELKAFDEDLHHEVKTHAANCQECRQTIAGFRKLSRTASDAISSGTAAIDTTGLGAAVYKRSLSGRAGGVKKVFDYFSLKLYLKVASVAAVMVLCLVYFQGRPVTLTGPSAIVTSVDARASVMIFETQKNKHTIIWFTET